jgi:hypothetical protein
MTDEQEVPSATTVVVVDVSSFFPILSAIVTFFLLLLLTKVDTSLSNRSPAMPGLGDDVVVRQCLALATTVQRH